MHGLRIIFSSDIEAIVFHTYCLEIYTHNHACLCVISSDVEPQASKLGHS